MSCRDTAVLPIMLTMQITYKLTERDFRDGFVAYFKSRGIFRVVKPLIIGAIVIALLLSIVAAGSRCQSRQLVMNLVPLYAVIALWVLVLWGSPWWGARRQFRNQPSAQGQKTLTISDAGLEWQGSTGKSEAYWSNFIRWSESKSLILLFPSPAFFHVLPKCAFSNERLAEFRQMLEQRIGPMNKQRNV